MEQSVPEMLRILLRETREDLNKQSHMLYAWEDPILSTCQLSPSQTANSIQFPNEIPVSIFVEIDKLIQKFIRKFQHSQSNLENEKHKWVDNKICYQILLLRYRNRDSVRLALRQKKTKTDHWENGEFKSVLATTLKAQSMKEK